MKEQVIQAGLLQGRAWSVCVPMSSILEVMPWAVVDAASALTPKGVKYVCVSTCPRAPPPTHLRASVGTYYQCHTKVCLFCVTAATGSLYGLPSRYWPAVTRKV